MGTTKTTMRERAIAARLRTIESEKRLMRICGGNEIADVFEMRDICREYIARAEAQLKTLRAMPVDVSDYDVLIAMGFDAEDAASVVAVQS